jgi:hypothetical protein
MGKKKKILKALHGRGYNNRKKKKAHKPMSNILRETEIKIMISYHSTLIRTAENGDNIKSWTGTENVSLSHYL